MNVCVIVQHFRLAGGLFLCLLLSLGTAAVSKGWAGSASEWEEVEPGLETRHFSLQNPLGHQSDVIIVRIDPVIFSFEIFSATVPGEKRRTLEEWAREHGLVAAINAGMYKEDGHTHTGYLRIGEHLNNSRVVRKFGAFFVTEPDMDNALPSVALLDRFFSPWESLLPRYSMVVQNYRLISGERRVQWLEEGTPHAVSAVGCDGTGRILFIHCSDAVRCIDLARRLLEWPIDIRQTMYVEGGSPAGLFLSAGRESRQWTGRSTHWPVGRLDIRLPNVIGVKRR